MKQHFIKSHARHSGAALFLACLLLCSRSPSALEDGVYHCEPIHSIHYLQLDDSGLRELPVNNEGVMIIISIDADTIQLQDSRAGGGKTIDVIDNAADGAIIGATGSRKFYMDPGLHYFYGSVGEGGRAVYAEDGRCRRY